MYKFIKEDFILQSETAKIIYNEVKDLPIIDYHCHLIPDEIANNKSFKNITEIWLGGDHYKWRAMRTWGIEEKYITGNASDFEKFEKWAETVENLIGSPLHHWVHLELKRYFSYDAPLTKNNAKEVYDHCNKIINSPDFNVLSILDKMKVEVICTTDDPIDTLEQHKSIKNNKEFKTLVLPTFRPSNAMNIENPNFTEYIRKLSNVSGVSIKKYNDIKKAMYSRIEYFNAIGCKLSDHALDPIVYTDYTEDELDIIVEKALNNSTINNLEVAKYKTALLYDLSIKYHEYNWTSQLHISCLRSNNTRMFKELGADTGFDSMDDVNSARALVATLNKLDSINKLCKTIIYSLNPTHDDMITTVIGGFQGGGIKGKIQLGSAWWFNDHKMGMEKQMTALANNGMLACFVGMLTDSRSFLSYPRHEYFRRILCDLLGNLVETGQYPNDIEKVVEIAKNICYFNAKNYFKF
ncbi:MAG: glucuronate isomerase [Lachnospirales bacterium]